MGKYFIQAYRLFKMLPEINAMIFWKRQENRTCYKFFVVYESVEEMRKGGKEGGGRVEVMKKNVEKMTRKELVDYSISVALVQ